MIELDGRPPASSPSADAAPASDDALLEAVERAAFQYFVHEWNPVNGLTADKTKAGWPASIAAAGLALATYPAGVERGWMTRAEVVRRALIKLRFFARSPQGPEADATGYRGFYYHFLDMETGRRAFGCELSTIDTALLIAGALAVATYLDRDDEAEHEIRALADALYRRVDWRWALDGGATLTHGWNPETGFIPHRWEGYDEALILYVLVLGSPTFPIPEESYTAWTAGYQWRTVHGQEYLQAGPLFTHQLSHVWVDFRGIQDRPMRERGLDYFENSRRATYAQQAYAIANPGQWAGYGPLAWGITASDGPGDVTHDIEGRERRFFDYVARGIPDGPDDGTLAPWAVVASLPFAPDIVLPTVRNYHDLKLHPCDSYGFKATFNATFPATGGHPAGWVSPYHYGVDQGPTVLMTENARSDLLWRLTRSCAPIVRGLRRAGFSGGWL